MIKLIVLVSRRRKPSYVVRFVRADGREREIVRSREQAGDIRFYARKRGIQVVLLSWQQD